MKSKSFIITAVSICLIAQAQGQEQHKLSIDAATVFLSGAELLSSTKLNLAKGENEILFTNVAGDVNSQSLSVKATNGVVVEAATFQNNYLSNEVLSPHAREIKDSIEQVKDVKAGIETRISVISEQIAALKDNKKVGGNNTGMSVAELTKLLDLIGARMEGYMTQKNKEEDKLRKTNELLTKLEKQLNEEQKKAYQPGGQLLVKFYAKEATNADIVISYVVPHAGWSPTYDIWADDAHSPVKLFYKANIYQNSGVKWNNVRLVLSTGNPSEGAQAPVISPWYLAFYVPPQIEYAAGRADIAAYKKPLVDQDKPSSHILMAEQTSINNYVTVDNSGVNTSFDIDLPYTIPSDGQQHLVSVKKYDMPATYRYYAAPKLDHDAFLQAQITNWEDLNLLPGQTNIFYEGTYVGQGYMDVRNLKDTMTFSLGRDKKIVIKREQDKTLRSVKTIGINVRETFGYNITIRNTRKEPVNLMIIDQLPVSNDKDIVLEDKNTGNAEYDETNGSLKWLMTLGSNESKKLDFGYTVKYPKGKEVTGLR